MSGRLFTVTLNPAIDLTIRLRHLTPGEVHRAEGQQAEAGGKGLGVAAVMAALGRPVVACGWLGRDNDGLFLEAFARLGVQDAMVRVPGATRTNIKLAVQRRGDATDINLPGIGLAAVDQARARAALLQHLATSLRPGDWCELAGSLPPGADPQVWLAVARCAHEAGAQLVLDMGGADAAALLPQLTRAAQGAPVPVAFMKPNRAELEALVGRPLASVLEVAEAAAHWVQSGQVRQVVVSLGGEGAVLVSGQGRWLARAPSVPVATTVGAGDALVAGTVHALMAGQSLPQAGVFGMACAAARIQRIAPGLPDLSEVEALAAHISWQAV